MELQEIVNLDFLKPESLTDRLNIFTIPGQTLHSYGKRIRLHSDSMGEKYMTSFAEKPLLLEPGWLGSLRSCT